MNKQYSTYLKLLVLGVLVSSCVSNKKMLYFQDVEGVETPTVIANYEPKIQPGDLLNINVAAAEAEAAATRKPATGGQVYELDPVTGKLRAVDQGLKGATPEVIRDTGANLASAAEKVSGGQKFAMSASEKIAWDRTKVDLAELAPGFDKLSDKAIAERMADRNWAQQMVQKAKDQARAFEEIAARAADERAHQEAFAARERMMDLAEMLDEQLRVVKPKKIHQGPKTREAKRNALRGSVENQNALVQ